MLTEDQINKLPKWAQLDIRTLIMRVDEALKEINRLNESPESNTIVGYGYTMPHEDINIKYLKDNENITFKLSNGTIRARIKNDCIDINSDSNADLVIKPLTSNSLLLKLIKT